MLLELPSHRDRAPFVTRHRRWVFLALALLLLVGNGVVFVHLFAELPSPFAADSAPGFPEASHLQLLNRTLAEIARRFEVPAIDEQWNSSRHVLLASFVWRHAAAAPVQVRCEFPYDYPSHSATVALTPLVKEEAKAPSTVSPQRTMLIASSEPELFVRDLLWALEAIREEGAATPPRIAPDQLRRRHEAWFVAPEWPGQAESGSDQDSENARRAAAVRRAFEDSWAAYESRCFGYDELKPVSGTCTAWLHMGATIIDALDTVYLMGLQPQYQRAREWVDKFFLENTQGPTKKISVFETTIRILGGLLSVYELSADPMFLNKADRLGRLLARAFEGDPHGLPYTEIHLATGEKSDYIWAHGVILADAGSLSMEFMHLAHHTGNDTYRQLVQRVIDHLDGLQKPVQGLYPVQLNRFSAHFQGERVTIGGMGDSFYEYLLKAWLLQGKRSDQLKRMYTESAEGIIHHLMRKAASLSYVAEMDGGNLHATMEHLVCFLPGTLALAASSGALDQSVADSHFKAAQELMETCVAMYERSPSGLAADTYSFGADGSMTPTRQQYRLRPETLESLFYMWRFTGDKKYQEHGWRIFEAIQRHCRVSGANGTMSGYATVADVTSVPVEHEDAMESFFLGETLKYLYLLFSPPSLLPLDQFVFTTEAHPLRPLPAKSLAQGHSLG